MKTKQFAITILTAMLLVTVFGSVSVFAPPPTKPNPPTLWDVFVTNPSDKPVPVDITDSSLEVNLDEPIEITNPDGESLAVEVTNPEDITLDVSGWLHTTKDQSIYYTILDGGADPRSIATRGYRQITVGFKANVDGHVWFDWIVGDDFTAFEEYFEFEAYRYNSLTFDVKGHTLDVTAFAASGSGDGDFEVHVYLTT